MKIIKRQFPHSPILSRCIYCGTSAGELTREHIVPRGINEQFTLQRASCKQCSNTTKEIERQILQGPVWEPRTKMRMSTRHKGQRPKTFPVLIEREGHRDEINVQIEKLPAWLWLPVFRLPAFIDKRHHDKRVETHNVSGGVWILSGQRLVKELGEELNADSIALTVTYTGHDFGRLLAKIAYGFAIREFGVRIIDHAYVLSAIPGDSKDIGKWVGCVGRQQDETDNLHEIMLSVKNGDIYAYIRLFAKYPVSPEYLVVVGRAPFHPQEDSLFIC